MEEKVLPLDKFSAVAKQAREPCSPYWFTKYTFMVHHVTKRKPTMMPKGVITFKPEHLTKVTYTLAV